MDFNVFRRPQRPNVTATGIRSRSHSNTLLGAHLRIFEQVSFLLKDLADGSAQAGFVGWMLSEIKE